MPTRPKSIRFHAQERAPDARPNAGDRGYDGLWQKVRRVQLGREPICRACKRQMATCVDHIIPLSQGGERLDYQNLQSLCRGCHAAKTGRERA